MAKRIPDDAGVNTRLAHGGNDPHDYYGFVNPPVVHASTVLFPDAATMASRSQKYTYGTRGTPTTDALAEAIDELEGSAGTIIVPSGLMAVVGAAARLPVRRRSPADGRFGLLPDPQLRRHDAEAFGRGGRVLRSRMSAPASPR